MTSEQGTDFWETAVQAAILGGEVILENLGRILENEVSSKQASDFVTRADRESENVIVSIIREKFPSHSILAEESHGKDEAGGYRWIVDPLDGTTNFIHRYPVFSVSIALEFDGDIIMGVIYDPVRDELFIGEKGKGAFLNGEAVSVSGVTDVKNSLITTGFPFRKKEMIDRYLELFRNVFLRVSDLRRAGSAALDLAYLACGRCDGFFEIGLGPWDIAAGSIIIREAGGIVTDFGGGQGFLSSGNIIAGNPSVHSELLKEIKGVFGGIIDN